MPHEPYKAALLFGAPGVGKGTQGAMLGAVPGFHHFSMGDAFRGLDPDSTLGQTVRGYSARGELVPDQITIELFKETIRERIEAGVYNPETDLLILDGIPRNPAQVELLEGSVQTLALAHIRAADQEAMVERLRRRALRQGRADDAKEDVIRRRWEVYHRETQPVLERHPAELVTEVDALGTPAQVLVRVLGALAPLQASVFENALA